MPRIHRFRTVHLNSTNHCMWRSHNGERVLEDEKFADKFLELLGKYKKQHGILIHSYCLMGTHPHVMVTASKGQAEFSRFWKVVNWCFARFYNKKKKRCGQVVRERLKSPTIRPDPDGRHQLTVMTYTDMNPVRAGLAKSPGKWKFSSHRHYAYGEHNPLIDDAPEYLGLAYSPANKRKFYRNLFAKKRVQEFMVSRPDFECGLYVGESLEDARKRERAAVSKKPPR